jgi:hypothetical protein
MRNGDVFPPMILWQRPDKSYYVLDGLHRGTARRKVDDHTDAYIVPPETPVRVRALISITFNARHGLALSKPDRIRHAMFLRETLKLSNGEAARRMGLTPNELQGAIDVENAEQRWAECLTLDSKIDPRVWDPLRPTTKVSLSRIKTDEAFIAAVQLAHDAGLSKSDVDRLVTELRPIRSSATQVGVVARWREDMAGHMKIPLSTGTGRARNGAQPPHVRAAIAMGGIRHLDSDRLAALPPREREMVVESVQEGIKKLQEILDAIAKATGSPA